MAPALTCGGILIWKRTAWGLILGGIASTQAALCLFVLSVNLVIAVRNGLADAPGELPVWGTLTIVTTAIGLLLFANVQRRPEPNERNSPNADGYL
jgi:hypothetical protein